MKYAYEDLVFADTELEDERLEFLDTLNRNHNWLRNEAQTLLGVKVRSVKPIGDITDPARFHEGSDVTVAFRLDDTLIFNQEYTDKLQEHFSKLPLPGIGVINVVVYSK